MRACRPSWCASGHRQPVRRTMSGAPSAAWSSTWAHGVGRRSMGSSISSISFAAASRRPRRSCQRSSTRSDQDRPTPQPAGPLQRSGPTGGMQVLDRSGRGWDTPLVWLSRLGPGRHWWQSPSVGALINEGPRLSSLPRKSDPRPTPLATAQPGLGGLQPPAGGSPHPVGRPGGPGGESERPQAGGPTQDRSRLRYQVPMEIASRP